MSFSVRDVYGDGNLSDTSSDDDDDSFERYKIPRLPRSQLTTPNTTASNTSTTASTSAASDTSTHTVDSNNAPRPSASAVSSTPVVTSTPVTSNTPGTSGVSVPSNILATSSSVPVMVSRVPILSNILFTSSSIPVSSSSDPVTSGMSVSSNYSATSSTKPVGSSSYVDDIDATDPSVLQAINVCRCLEADLLSEEMMIDEQDPESVVKASIEIVDKLRTKFSAAHTHLMSLLGMDQNASTKLAMDKRHSFLVKYKAIKSRLFGFLKNNEEKPCSSNSSSGFKFSKIEVPEFSGNQEDWMEWRRLYTSLVHDNQSLQTYQKYHILRTKVLGEPKILLKNFPLDDGSYSAAWDLMNSTYGNPVKGIARYLFSLDNLEPMGHRNSRKNLRNLITNFRSYVTAIQSTLAENPELDVLSQFIIYMFLKKTNEETRTEWELEANRRKIPAVFKEFIEYMDERCSAGEWANSSRSSDKDKREKFRERDRKTHKRSNTEKTLAIPEKRTKKSVCRVCDKDHRTHECPDLEKKTPEERLKYVKERRWCFRCLNSLTICRRKCGKFCSVCKGGHNNILHGGFPDSKKPSTSPLLADVSIPVSLPLSEGIKQNDSNNVSSDCRTNNLLESMDIEEPSTKQSLDIFNEGNKDICAVASMDYGKLPSVNNICVNKNTIPDFGFNNFDTLSVNINQGWVCSLSARNTYQLLATAIVAVQINGKSERLEVRALLDSCSQYNIATTNLVSKVKPKRNISKSIVGGIGNSSTSSNMTVNLTIFSICTNFRTEINCIVLDEIVDEVPSREFSVDQWSFPLHIKLADPHFNTPASVDLLLGTGVFWNALLTRHHRLGNGLPRFQQTKFGWIVTGDMNMQLCNSVGKVFCADEIESLDKLTRTLELFWLLDESTTKVWTDEERDCEQHFISTTTRTPDGRFVLRLPFKVPPSSLGHSKTQALRRFHSLERRFSNDPKFHHQYVDSINEMIAQGHLKQVKEDSSDLNYYIPHHAVIKESSATTKMRIVLDPTMKSSSGLSLNDCLMKGPTVQSGLMSILSRSRTRRYVFTADIKKMFLQFLRHPKDTCFQRILWREFPTGEILTWEFVVVPFGLRSSPFEATRSVVRLAELDGDQFPKAKKILLDSTYVDDVIDGADTIDEAIEMRNQLISLLKLAGLELSKWCSNSVQIIKDLPPTSLGQSYSLQYDNEIMIKTLGIRWLPLEDCYKVWVGPLKIRERYTKRQVLSVISSIFDPLGFIGPVLVLGKLIMQQLWHDQLDWDAFVPKHILNRWSEVVATLPDLNNIAIPRYLFDFNSDYIILELHGFADASEKAYGAVVYVRSIYTSHSLMRIISSKSRVAPLNNAKTTLPRLELCAAELLANLINKTIQDYAHLKFSSIRLWSDSEITLFWIRSPAERWLPFVANRVRNIKNLTKDFTWDHVGSKLNPADPLSRGVKPSELKDLTLWWNGPNFLTNTTNPTPPGSKYKFSHSVQEELKRPRHKADKVILAVVEVNGTWMEDFSSLDDLITKYGYLCRFIWNCHWFGPKIYGSLRLYEYNHTLMLLIQLAQRESFKDEYTRLKDGKPILRKSTLAPFCPFIDTLGVIRVGGRLRNADFSFEQRHPILLPPSHVLTRLIVRHEHICNLHAGPTLLKSVLRRKYWVVHTNKVIRHCITHCKQCIITRGNTRTQIMAALPRSRVTPQRAFAITGVDYAGPVNILVRGGPPRTRVISKAYICVFVCFSTKAIHIELVSDLTSDSFIAAFERFISRRGIPNEMHSDNGTTFVGAKRILSDLGKALLQNKDPIFKFWRSNGVNWQFIPPYAPHFGGLWEAGVKSVKSLLSKVIGDKTLTFEQYTTTLCQVEACLNSRPLVPESTDPNEINALTPGHFLIGGPITALPNPDLSNVPVNRLKYWELTKHLVQSFWKRWQNEYLHTLQERSKWRFEKDEVKIDDLVVIKDESLPPTQWMLGRIVKLHPGSDGHTRVVSVRIRDGKIIERTLSKIVLLPLED